MEKLAIVILNWNGRLLLEQFLPQLEQYTPTWAKIIIADNASTDDTLLWLKNNYPNISTIINDKNYGFAGGYNVALQQVKAEYYCLLNSDIEVSEGWLDKIIDFMDNHQDVGVCQPKLLSYYQKEYFEYAGAAGGYIDKYGYPFCRGRIFNEIEIDQAQYNDICEIFWASGACMFVRSEWYHKLGGLDTNFFAHMEEIDFCWRAKRNGLRIIYFPHSKVYHVGGGTLPKKSSRKTYLNFRNNMFLLYKNLPEKQLNKVFFIRFWLDIVAALTFLMTSGYDDFIAVFKARKDFKRMKSHYKNQRLESPPQTVGQIYQKSIVWQYYAKRVKFFYQLLKKDFFY